MPRCRTCKAELALATLDAFEGEESSVSVRIEGMPALACPNDHRRFLTPDYPSRLIESLLKADAARDAPRAVRKGLFRKRHHCPGCGAELPAARQAQARSTHALALKESAAFSVRIEYPIYRCGACTRESMSPNDELAPAVMRAVARAFEAAGIPPG